MVVGAILIVPILVYALQMDAKLSIALSLAIVGSTRLVGVIVNFKNKNIEIKLGLIFIPIAFSMGIITGLVGVGGCFLIVLTLVLFAKVTRHRAVGTSLFIINANSLFGFLGYLQYFALFLIVMGIFILYKNAH